MPSSVLSRAENRIINWLENYDESHSHPNVIDKVDTALDKVENLVSSDTFNKLLPVVFIGSMGAIAVSAEAVDMHLANKPNSIQRNVGRASCRAVTASAAFLAAKAFNIKTD